VTGAIHRAVLLAAGKGTRLGSLTENFPKPLLHVGGKPIIVRILDGLIAAGIDEVTIVTGHAATILETELGNGAESGMQIRYVRQESLDGTARAICLAREHVGDEPFFVSWGDIVVRRENYRNVVRASRLADAVIAVNEVDDPFAGAAVYFDEDGVVARIVEKPAKGTSTTRWNNAGLGILTAAIWPEIGRLQPSPRGEYELPQAISALVASGARVRAVPIEGPWFDIGTPESLEAARAEFDAAAQRGSASTTSMETR
jgi:UDP-N-acetylglucosamine diphosphorylase / glucose-1-phosphate thymidylyltransferase / UDP-N-acetylgalactosamine diphosphorylase / glucosamine-1-phosphate N-acetyltransferase / galactosamine-1-phosphate N-acetyltransferase